MASLPPGDEGYSFVAPIYVVCGSLSLLLAWAMALVYAWNPHVREDHSSTLIHLMTCCEAIYSFKFFASALLWYAGFRDGRASFHLLPDNCASSIAYGQLFGMAAIAWNACWMTDILVTLFLPLRNSATLLPWYHAAVWTLALGTTLLVALGGVGSSGLSGSSGDTHTCWLRGDAGLSYSFEAPLLLFVVLAFTSLILAAWRLRGGGTASQRLRSGVLLRHLAYVVAFIALWLFPIIHSFLDRNGTVFFFSLVDAIAVSSQATATTVIRLSEPGAWRTFTSTMRRLRNTLAAGVGCRVRHFHPASSEADGALHSEAPLPLYAIFPCLLCSKRGQAQAQAQAGSAAEDSELQPLHSMRKGSREDGEGGSGAASAGTAKPWSFWGALSGSGSVGQGGVTASSALLAHAQVFSPAGAAFRLLGGGAEGSSAGPAAAPSLSGRRSPSLPPSGSGSGEGGSSGSGVPSATSSPRFGAASAAAAAATTPKAEGAEALGGSWSELSAELRQEMGVAMLTGLVQAVKLASAASEGVVAGVAAAGKGAEPLDIGSAAGGGGEAQDSSDSSSSGSEGEGEGGDAQRSPSTPRTLLLREASHSVVKGPSAPAQRRRIGLLLRDPGTVTRKVPSLLNLGSRSSLLSVSALEEAAFAELRRAGGIQAAYIAAQFDPALYAEGKLRAYFSEGASSSFFCRSSDDVLVVKTITGSEAEVLVRLLPAYIRHMRDNPESLLCRFYGAFAVTLPSLARVFFVVMQNVHPVTGAPPGAAPAAAAAAAAAPPHAAASAAFTFDLKGSTINRRARVSKSAAGGLKYLWQDMEFRETLPRGIPLVDGATLLAQAAQLGGGGVEPGGGRGCWWTSSSVTSRCWPVRGLWTIAFSCRLCPLSPRRPRRTTTPTHTTSMLLRGSTTPSPSPPHLPAPSPWLMPCTCCTRPPAPAFMPAARPAVLTVGGALRSPSQSGQPWQCPCVPWASLSRPRTQRAGRVRARREWQGMRRARVLGMWSAVTGITSTLRACPAPPSPLAPPAPFCRWALWTFCSTLTRGSAWRAPTSSCATRAWLQWQRARALPLLTSAPWTPTTMPCASWALPRVFFSPESEAPRPHLFAKHNYTLSLPPSFHFLPSPPSVYTGGNETPAAAAAALDSSRPAAGRPSAPWRPPLPLAPLRAGSTPPPPPGPQHCMHQQRQPQQRPPPPPAARAAAAPAAAPPAWAQQRTFAPRRPRRARALPPLTARAA